MVTGIATVLVSFSLDCPLNDHLTDVLGNVRQPIVQWLFGQNDSRTGHRTKEVAMALIGYARVSTTEQDTTLQTDALLKVGTHRILMIRRVSRLLGMNSAPSEA